MPNPFCSSCRRSHNTINGRFCTLLNCYVEHANTPPCSTIKNKKKK